MSGPSGGQYEPCDAKVYAPVRGSSHGEPVHGEPRLVYTGPLRFPKYQYSREAQQQGQTVSVSVLYIRMRKNSLTETIAPEMEIHHRRKVYGIVGINPIDSSTDEVEFSCNIKR